MIYFIFGGEQFYASGGVNDLLVTTHDKKLALHWAENFIGKEIKIVESYMPEDLWTETKIEWTQVMDETGNKIDQFGVIPYGNGNNKMEINGFDDIRMTRGE